MQKKQKTSVSKGYSQLEDTALKAAAQYFGESLLPYVGVKEKFVRIAPTEIPRLEVRKLYEDFNFEMENGWWYHLEFESDSITLEDLKRFREYEAATSRLYHVPVVTAVLCTSKAKKLLSEFTEGLNTYRVQVFRLKDENADQLFKELQKENSITKEKLIPLLLSPFMSGEMKVKDRILRGFQWIQHSEADFCQEEMGKMQAVLYAFANKLLDKAELEEVREALMMTRLGQMIWEDGVENGIKKGLAQGISKGITQGIETGIAMMIRENLEENKSEEQICGKLVRLFSLKEEDAREYYRKYSQ